MAEWLHLPLLVAEAGVDPGAYKNNAFDSYAYGLKEALGSFPGFLLRYARPQAHLLAVHGRLRGGRCAGTDGSIEPTARFWPTEQFVNLTRQRARPSGHRATNPGCR